MTIRLGRPDAIASLATIEDYTLDTAEEFLEFLSARGGRWQADPEAWIYRGQAELAWELQPKSRRGTTAFDALGVALKSSATPGSESERRSLLVKEMLRAFRSRMNEAGLSFPQEIPPIGMEDEQQYRFFHLPQQQSWPLMALAQHHGLPTPLLDWSRRAWVAAYFAAADAAARARANEQEGTHMLVWAMNRAAARSANIPVILLFEAPGAGNHNLHAQQGLFTLSVDEDESSVERLVSGSGYLRRAHLPVTEAGRLLRLLASEGISGGSLFPGPDGIVRGMRERALWA